MLFMGVPLVAMFVREFEAVFQPTVSVPSATTRKLDKQHVLPKKELRLLTNLRLFIESRKPD